MLHFVEAMHEMKTQYFVSNDGQGYEPSFDLGVSVADGTF